MTSLARLVPNPVLGLVLATLISAGALTALSSPVSAEISVADYRASVINLAEQYPNFGGSIWHRETKTLVILGTGNPPRSVRKYLDDPPTRVTARWRESPYNRRELLRECRRLIGDYPKRVLSVQARRHADGVTVFTRSQSLLNAEHPRRRLASSYPVTVKRYGGVAPA